MGKLQIMSTRPLLPNAEGGVRAKPSPKNKKRNSKDNRSPPPMR